MPRRLRILFVTPYLPRRGVSAARQHWWELLSRLADRHDVTLLAFVDRDDLDEVGVDGLGAVLPAGLAAVHPVPKTAWRPEDPLAMLPRTVAGGYSNPALARAIEAHVGGDASGPFDLIQYEFSELAHLVPPPPPGVPTILTVHQIAFAAEAPFWRAGGRGARRGAVLLHRYLRELDFELRAIRRVHHVITVTPEDGARLRSFHPGLRLSVSPVGVDAEHFRPPAAWPAPETDMLFVGNFEHPPNGDAMRFLVHQVMPRMRRASRLRIVGRGITPDVAALARPGVVEVVGAVDDLRPHLACARVVVAPVRFGTGMRGKVLEALAMARPVVTTSVGAEGLGATVGVHVLLADTARDFAAAVDRVCGAPELARDLARGGRALVESRFGWDAVALHHERIHEAVRADPGPPPAAREWQPDPSRALALRIARLGRWPGIAMGAALLSFRGVRWHRARHRRSSRDGRAVGAAVSSSRVPGTDP